MQATEIYYSINIKVYWQLNDSDIRQQHAVIPTLAAATGMCRVTSGLHLTSSDVFLSSDALSPDAAIVRARDRDEMDTETSG